MIAFAETDLPEPDSPTIATVSPRFTVRLTPRTALTTPAVVSKEMSRFRTRKISSFFSMPFPPTYPSSSDPMHHADHPPAC